MTTVPIAAARAQLSKLVDEASLTHERIEITKNGRRAAVIMGAGDYDAMRETIAVLSDSALLLAQEVGVRDFAKGGTLNADQLAEAMNNVGRSVDTK